MTEQLALLEEKLSSSSDSKLSELNYKLSVEYGISQTAQDEVGYFLQCLMNGQFSLSNAYEFLYKFIDFYYENESYLSDFANIIIYAVSKEMIDPIDGSRLIGSIWAVIGYPQELIEFIGLEGEVEAKDNRLRTGNLEEEERLVIEDELKEIKRNLISVAKVIIKNNTI